MHAIRDSVYLTMGYSSNYLLRSGSSGWPRCSSVLGTSEAGLGWSAITCAAWSIAATRGTEVRSAVVGLEGVEMFLQGGGEAGTPCAVLVHTKVAEPVMGQQSRSFNKRAVVL